MKNRIAGVLALLIVAIPHAGARADLLSLTFSGTIDAAYDADDPATPPIDFTPIPVGSPFSGTFTYDPSSPPTFEGPGFATYQDFALPGDSLTANGQTFTATEPGDGIVVSQEAGFGFSGLSITGQPIALPAGWSVATPFVPYFTVRFRDASPQARSLALPTTVDGFPADTRELILDFGQRVTVAGQVYGGRVYITGSIASLSVTAVPEPSAFVLAGTGGLGLFGYARRRRGRA